MKRDAGAALGAQRQIPLTRRTLQGPLDWLVIARELETRLASRGGRPSDPRWDIQRLVPLSSDTWAKLKRASKRFSGGGKHISPAQLASALIEKALEHLH